MNEKDQISAKDAAYIMQGGRCIYCGRVVSHTKATCEHLTPRSYGGKRTYGNVRMACRQCNQARGNGSWLVFWMMMQAARNHGIIQHG